MRSHLRLLAVALLCGAIAVAASVQSCRRRSPDPFPAAQSVAATEPMPTAQSGAAAEPTAAEGVGGSSAFRSPSEVEADWAAALEELEAMPAAAPSTAEVAAMYWETCKLQGGPDGIAAKRNEIARLLEKPNLAADRRALLEGTLNGVEESWLDWGCRQWLSSLD